MYPFNRFVDKTDDVYDRHGMADIPVFAPAPDERDRVRSAFDRRQRAARRALRMGVNRQYLRPWKGARTLARRTVSVVLFGVVAVPLAILALVMAPLLMRFADWRASRARANSGV